MRQIIFDTFNTPVMYKAIWVMLSLYAPGHTIGVVVYSGNIVHIYSVLAHTALCLDLAGRYLTICFIKILTEWGYSLTPQLSQRLVADIKEKLLYCPGC